MNVSEKVPGVHSPISRKLPGASAAERPRPAGWPVAALAASAAGGALLSLPASYWRIDGASGLGHGRAASVACAAAYALALALLAYGWRQATASRLGLGVALASGAIVNGVAVLAPPFLSLDPLCYAAIGRAIARFHQSPYRPLFETLPPGDPFLLRLPPLWQHQGSAYSSGFHVASRIIATFAGDSLGLFLRSLQLLNVAAMFVAAWLTAIAVGIRQPEARGRAAALVLFCPLTIVEATVSAHNDALMAACVGAFVLAVELRHHGARLIALTAGALVKASGLLLLFFGLTELVVARAGARLRGRTLAIGFAVAAVLALGGLLVLNRRIPSLQLVLALIGSPLEAPHCTRSIECIPRALLFYGFHASAVAWWLGLVFRLAGVGWLGYAGWRAARAGEPALLPWAAAALFFYYLYLHGYMQSWYLLSLVPLLPFAPPRLRPAMSTFCISALAYYVLRLPLADDVRPWVVGAKELGEGLIVIVPPSIALLVTRRRRPERALTAAASRSGSVDRRASADRA